MTRHALLPGKAGRRCHICKRIGGSGSTAILRLLGYDIPKGQIGYAHSDCVARERRRQAKAQEANHGRG